MNTKQMVASLEDRARRVGLSMREVCRRTEVDGRKPVSPATISRWKNGSFDPRMSVMARLDAVVAAEERAADHEPSAAQT